MLNEKGVRMSSGRFDTTTKTKIHTKYGTILKVTRYEVDCTRPDIEYKIRGKCIYCNKETECYCYSADEFENPLEEATCGLQYGFVCEDPQCVIKHGLDNDPETTNQFIENYGDDLFAIRDAIWETWGEWDDGPIECGIY